MNVAVGKVMKNLALFIGLKPSKCPEVEIDEKSTPRQFVTDLVRARLMPHHSEVPEEMIDLVRKVEEEGRSKVKGCVVDLLGLYLPEDNRVILFDKLIRECARKLGFSIVDLRNVVLRHELAHQVTHRGLDADGEIWRNFGAATRQKKEYFAQLYAYKFARRERWMKGIEIMTVLSRHQTMVYSTYKRLTRLSMDSIYRQLMKERKRKPAVLHQYGLKELPICETPLDKVQGAIDLIEGRIRRWQEQRKDTFSSMVEIAEALGYREAYEALLESRDYLMWSEEKTPWVQ